MSQAKIILPGVQGPKVFINNFAIFAGENAALGNFLYHMTNFHNKLIAQICEQELTGARARHKCCNSVP